MKLFGVVRSLIAFLAQIYLFSIASFTLWILIPMAILWTPTVVISGSMEPLIMTGDVVSAKQVSADEVHAGAIKAGMVVLAENPLDPGHLYTHRVIQVNSDKSMVTKGDANVSPDPIALTPEKVKGIEMLRIPFIGLPALKMREGDTASLAAMGMSVFLAMLIVQRAYNQARLKDEENSLKFSTRAEAKAAAKSDKSGFKSSYALAASIIAVILVSMIGGSSASFTGYTGQPNNSWKAAATFPAP